MPPLKIWTNIRYPDAAMQLLRDGTGGHELMVSAKPKATPLDPGKPDDAIAQADIAFGQPDPDQLLATPKLKWTHLDSAGYTRYDRDDVRSALRARSAILTNSSGVFDEPCAQHALAMMLAFSRQLPQAVLNQHASRGWPILEIRKVSRLLIGETVLIFGFGAIARRLIELLAPFRMNIVAVRRNPRGDEPVKIITDDESNNALGQADHVINILPDNASTQGLFTAERFARMRPEAYFYNIGRGTTVDQTALIATLKNERLAAAYLDVTDPEPLPPNHPLWQAKNCHITPHTAGGHANEHERLVRHFLNNLERFVGGDKLSDEVFA